MNKIIWYIILLSGIALMVMAAIFQYNIVVSTSQIIIVLLAIFIIAIILILPKRFAKLSRKDEMGRAIEYCKTWWLNMYNEDLTRLDGTGKRRTFYNPVDTSEKKDVIGFLFFRGSGKQKGMPALIIYGVPDQILDWSDNPDSSELRNVFTNFHPFITEEFKGRVPKTVAVQPTIDIDKLGEKRELDKLRGKK